MKIFFSLLIILLGSSLFAQTNWHTIATGVENKLNVIDFPTTNVGYIGGNDTLILKTVDAGKTWSTLNHSGISVFPGGENILDLKFINKDIGFLAAGPYGTAYKTIDGGLNWTAIPTSGNLCYIESLYFFDETHGLIGGAGCFQGELVDIYNGIGPSQGIMNQSGFAQGTGIVDMDFLDTAFGLAVSAAGRVYRTTNGGANWDSISTGLGLNIPLTSIKIINDTLAYAGYENLGQSWGILKTTDAGLTWATDGNSATFFYPSFFDVIENELGHIYLACEVGFAPYGLIMEHKGLFWNYTSVDQPIYAMTFYADSVVWAVGDSGLVLVNIDPITLSTIENPINFGIAIYPNPATDFISIEITNGNPKIELVKVYDLRGRLLKIERENPNFLDLSMLRKGIYILEVQTEIGSESVRVLKE